MENFWDLHIAYVRECEKLNWANDIDPHHHQMEWHHILPQCLFGNQSIGVWLTLRQHAIASCLQTLAFRKKCFCAWHQKFVPDWLWKQCVQTCQQELSAIGTLGGLAGGSKGGTTTKERGVGIFGLTEEQRRENARFATSKVRNRNSAPGGRVSGPLNRDNQRGLFDPKNKERVREGARKCGAKRAQQMAQEGFPGLGSSPEAAREAGKKAAAQRWKCLVTGHISSAGALANFQKARNIDTSLRERLE